MANTTLSAIADPAYQAQIRGLKQMTALINDGIARQGEHQNSLVPAVPAHVGTSLVETPLS